MSYCENTPTVMTYDYSSVLNRFLTHSESEKDKWTWNELNAKEKSSHSRPGQKIDPSYNDGKKWTPAQCLNFKINITLFLGAIAEGSAIYVAYTTTLVPVTFVAVILGIGLLAGIIWRFTQGPDLDDPKERAKIILSIAEKITKGDCIAILTKFSFNQLYDYDLLDLTISSHLKPQLYAQASRVCEIFLEVQQAYQNSLKEINDDFSGPSRDYHAQRFQNGMLRHAASHHRRNVVRDKESGAFAKGVAYAGEGITYAATAIANSDATRHFNRWQKWKRDSERKAHEALQFVYGYLNQGLCEAFRKITEARLAEEAKGKMDGLPPSAVSVSDSATSDVTTDGYSTAASAAGLPNAPGGPSLVPAPSAPPQ